MTKKDAKKTKNEDTTTADAADDEPQDDKSKSERAPQQVEIGDFVKVKQMLDESTAAAVIASKYPENLRWDNTKLALMVVACLFAMVAQFYPMPFPESRPLLGVCCTSYFIASSVLQLIVTYIEQDTIMLTFPKEDDDGKRIGTDDDDGLRIRTNFPRFQYDYTITVQKNVKDGPRTTESFIITDYFTEDGWFDADGFEEDVKKKAIQKFEAKKFD